MLSIFNNIGYNKNIKEVTNMEIKELKQAYLDLKNDLDSIRRSL